MASLSSAPGLPAAIMHKRLQAIIQGQVQGVSFRYYTQKEARRLGLTGWVRNQPDGTVLCVAEGDEPALLIFTRFLHQGPAAARVTEVKLTWATATGEFADFAVRYLAF